MGTACYPSALRDVRRGPLPAKVSYFFQAAKRTLCLFAGTDFRPCRRTASSRFFVWAEAPFCVRSALAFPAGPCLGGCVMLRCFPLCGARLCSRACARAYILIRCPACGVRLWGLQAFGHGALRHAKAGKTVGWFPPLLWFLRGCAYVACRGVALYSATATVSAGAMVWISSPSLL